jgi:SAM-dependent methyltransferase
MTIRPPTWLRAWWWRQQFEPGWAGLLVNPFFLARRGLWQELRVLFKDLTGEVLDVGCGRKPYRAHLPATRYVGLDIDSAATRALGMADVVYDGKTLPFPGASFDGVLCSQVFEHVFTPEEFLREICRVLRPGGRLLLTVPFVWDEHEQPQDFGRYTSFGVRALLERNGFEIVALRKSVTGGLAVAQLASGLIFKVTLTRYRLLNLLAQIALIAPVNLLGAAVAGLFRGSTDLYLDNVVLAHKRFG